MRGIISVIVVCLGFIFIRPEPPKLEHKFTLHPTHKQYIQDSIQPPIPQTPIKIHWHLAWSNPKLKGLTYQIDETNYIIHLNKAWSHEWWLVTHHELVHVKQLTRRTLQRHHTIWTWRQDTIDWNQPYMQRPWELEAFREANQIRLRTQPNHRTK